MLVDDITCTVCGNKIKDSGKQKTGRPRQNHDECRGLMNAISLLQNKLIGFKSNKPVKEKKNQIRRILWNAANGLN